MQHNLQLYVAFPQSGVILLLTRLRSSLMLQQVTLINDSPTCRLLAVSNKMIRTKETPRHMLFFWYLLVVLYFYLVLS